ncbi:MobF family relaxase [Novosphingobium gossypii]|uniref:MobF family relaxase n=1 Tax=Novosphingobium gossypii TaxID=1604774 RepID=UPI003D1FF6F7
MLSVASVKSAGGAASYFAKDDYYTGENASEMSVWGGQGAEELGLSGPVKADAFEAILNGILPNGTGVNQTPNRTIGTDLTFSMPKSASVLAYVAGDRRVLEAHLNAVKATMTWVEKSMAEARDYGRNRNGEPVRTSNLIYAIFQHDTSRKLDPQGHLHVVIAAITKTAGGTWQALWNNPLYKNNTAIGSAYHAAFREELRELGYETRLTGKHGQFEIDGVPKAVMEAFSQRREEILQKAAEIGISTPQGQDRVVVNTRDAKLNVADKEALRVEWKSRAAALGFDGRDVVSQALVRSGPQEEKPLGVIGKVQELVTALHVTLGQYLRGSDPLVTSGMARMRLTPGELRTELAVASAVRHHGQREAAFQLTDIYKTALNFGLGGVTIDRVEQRVGILVDRELLIPGASLRADGVYHLVTTPEHIAQERKLLAGIDLGRDASVAIVPAGEVADRLKAHTAEHRLNPEQLAAVTMALSTTDRIAVIQGVAGAGKTTLVRSLRDLAAEQGRETVGLAFANKMVATLRNEADIKAQTVSSFVNAHVRASRAGQGEAFENSRAELAGKIFVLDEASLISNEAMNNLLTIANRLGVERLVMIGDMKQLQSIDAGKAYELAQSHGPAMAVLEVSQRQKTAHMQQVAVLGRAGKFDEAFQILGTRVQSEGDAYLEKAAEKWLGLDAQERERTAIYASGRNARRELNELVQRGLKDEGTLKGGGLELTTLQQVNATREELRYASTYRPGQIIDVARNTRPAGLVRGRYDVVGVDTKGQVTVRNERGRAFVFDPQKIDPNAKSDGVQLLEKMPITLYEGDKILWQANDKAREIYSSEQAKILSITESHARIENADGKVVELDRADKMLERLGLAYAINMHQAQGMTTDKGIGAVHSSESNLATQRLTYVMLTRVRLEMEIVTNDRHALLRTISRNAGDKHSALEAIGDKQLGGASPAMGSSAAAPISAAIAGFNPSIPADVLQAPPNMALIEAAGFQRHLAAKEVNLPERNIERTR